MKKLIALILALISVFALAVPALAAFTPFGAEVPAKEPEMTELFIKISGTVLSVEDGAILVAVDGGEELVLNVDANTAILDNSAKKAAKLSAIEAGEKIIAWHSAAVMMSLPAQAYCYALLFNIEEGQPVGQLIEAVAVEKTEYGTRVLNQEEDLWFTVRKGFKIPVIGGGKLNGSALTVGSRIVVWYDIVNLSYPAQAGSDDVIALAPAYDGSIYAADGKATVNGKEVAAIVTEDGETFIDLKAAARKLGFKVTFNKKTETLTVRKGASYAAFEADKAIYNLRGAAEEYAAPVLVDGVLYGSADAFMYLGNFKIVK